MWEVKAISLLNLPFLLVGFLVLLVLLAPFDLVLLVSPFVLLSGQLVLFAIQLFLEDEPERLGVAVCSEVPGSVVHFYF